MVYGTEIFLSCVNGPHQRIQVIRFEEEFSRKPIILIDTVFNESGKVSFDIGCSDICPIEIRTESCFGKWFLEPGMSYNLGFMIPDSSFTLSENNVPEIIISNLDKKTNCLADSIRRFEETLDVFYRINAPFFVQPRLLAKELEKFKREVEINFLAHSGPFLSVYIQYLIAPIEEAAYQNKRAIFKKYFSSPFQFKNPAYVSYFKQFFKKYIWVVSNKTSSNFLLNDVNESASIELLNQHLLNNDSLLINDTLRQMVIIFNLSEIFYNKNFNRNQIEKLLKQLSTSKCITPFHCVIAKNLLSNLTYFERGNPSPLFELPGADGKLFQLSNEKGKWLYLSFFATWDQQSIAELKALQKIALKYGLKVKFIYIVLEGSNEGVADIKKYLPSGSILLDDREKKMTKDLYFVKEYPKFMFLDPELDIYSSKPPAPSENLEQYFKDVLKKKN
jgi:hypothetical protein